MQSASGRTADRRRVLVPNEMGETYCNASGAIRTRDLRFRKPLLYPAELRPHEHVPVIRGTGRSSPHIALHTGLRPKAVLRHCERARLSDRERHSASASSRLYVRKPIRNQSFRQVIGDAGRFRSASPRDRSRRGGRNDGRGGPGLAWASSPARSGRTGCGRQPGESPGCGRSIHAGR